MLLFRNLIRNILKIFNLNIFKTNIKKLDQFIEKIFIYSTEHELIRIGNSHGDGGYLLPKILDKIEFCFSAGVGNNTSFEDDIKKYNVKSFLADGTEKNNKFSDIKNVGYDIIKKNINSFNNESNITLENWVNSKVGKENKSLLLQMDIEGSEIPVLYQCDLNLLKRFKIMIIEFHDFEYLGNDFGLRVLNEIFDKILINFKICHIHPNNCCGFYKVNHYKIPRFMEITFLNKNSFNKLEKIKENLPHKLDKKCKTELKDISLPEFFYK